MQRGFTITELAVVLIIASILVVLSIPTYKSVMVTARRGEAKVNLSHIDSLQSVFKVAGSNFTYGSISKNNPVGYKGECSGGGSGWKNELGFRPNRCGELRYQYWTTGGGNFTAVAYGPSDTAGKYIYPDCTGAGTPAQGCNGEDYSQGDVLMLASTNGKIDTCRNILEYCPTPGGGTPSTPSTPGGTPGTTPTPTCTYSWTSSTVNSTTTTSPSTATSAADVCSNKDFIQTTTDTGTCSGTCPPPCPKTVTNTTNTPGTQTTGNDVDGDSCVSCTCQSPTLWTAWSPAKNTVCSNAITGKPTRTRSTTCTGSGTGCTAGTGSCGTNCTYNTVCSGGTCTKTETETGKGTKCCDGSGNPKTCSTGKKLDASCNCVCDNTQACCNGNAIEPKPANCTGTWKGVYNSTAADLGCCSVNVTICNTSNQCCDGTTPVAKPSTCGGTWTGTYNASDKTKNGCCSTCLTNKEKDDCNAASGTTWNAANTPPCDCGTGKSWNWTASSCTGSCVTCNCGSWSAWSPAENTVCSNATTGLPTRTRTCTGGTGCTTETQTGSGTKCCDTNGNALPACAGGGTRDSNCDCPCTAERACTEVNTTPPNTWSSGNCSSCNAGEQWTLDAGATNASCTGSCVAPICTSTQCCTGTRKTTQADCATGELLKAYPTCCTTCTNTDCTDWKWDKVGTAAIETLATTPAANTICSGSSEEYNERCTAPSECNNLTKSTSTTVNGTKTTGNCCTNEIACNATSSTTWTAGSPGVCDCTTDGYVWSAPTGTKNPCKGSCACNEKELCTDLTIASWNTTSNKCECTDNTKTWDFTGSTCAGDCKSCGTCPGPSYGNWNPGNHATLPAANTICKGITKQFTRACTTKSCPSENSEVDGTKTSGKDADGNCCGTTTYTNWSGSVDSKWECESVTMTRNVTTSYGSIPPAGCTNSTVQETKEVCGANSLACSARCTSWGAVRESVCQLDSGNDRKCEKEVFKARTCSADPCTDTSDNCYKSAPSCVEIVYYPSRDCYGCSGVKCNGGTYDGQTISAAESDCTSKGDSFYTEEESGFTFCGCKSAPTCAAGSDTGYVGLTLGAAETKCTNSGTNKELDTTTDTNTGEITCKCEIVTPCHSDTDCCKTDGTRQPRPGSASCPATAVWEGDYSGNVSDCCKCESPETGEKKNSSHCSGNYVWEASECKCYISAYVQSLIATNGLRAAGLPLKRDIARCLGYTNKTSGSLTGTEEADYNSAMAAIDSCDTNQTGIKHLSDLYECDRIKDNSVKGVSWWEGLPNTTPVCKFEVKW